METETRRKFARTRCRRTMFQASIWTKNERHLHEGKLFCLKGDQAQGQHTTTDQHSEIVYFWMCSAGCSVLELTRDAGGGISVKALMHTSA
jgi:hypothetical protein